MRRRLWAALAAAASVVAGSAGAQAVAPQPLGARIEGPLLRWDPAVRLGHLPNGLRYAVQRSGAPKDAISLRLGIAVGSYDEADDERGAAHFVEHLAFDSTRSFPESQLDLTFAPIGVTFGRDRNAAADLRRTIYRLDLPTTDPRELDAAMKWLRDVADGLVFAEPAVERERAAIQAERAARGGALGPLRERMAAFEDGGLRSGAREPIGAADSVAAMTPARLKAFHDRWYRPDNAILVIVGDLPVDVLEARVQAVFGSWTPAGPGGSRAPRTPPAVARGPEIDLTTDTRFPAVGAICRVTDPDGAGSDADRLRALLLRGLWESILQARLTALEARPGAAFAEASITDEPRPDSLKTCIAVAPVKGREADAIATVLAGVQRFAAEGPSEDETAAALGQVRASIRNGIGGAGRPSPDRASEILDRALDAMPQLAPREGLQAFDVLMEDVGPQGLRAAFARDWSGWGPLVAIGTPAPLPEGALRAALAADASAGTGPLAARAATPTPASSPPLAPEVAALVREGSQSLGEGRFKPALKAFNAALERDPKAAEALYGRARAYAAQGIENRATDDFNAALSLQPDNAAMLNARGNFYVAQERSERAIADFDHALAINPKDDIVLFNRGVAYAQFKRYDRAIRDFDAVLRLTPGDAATLAAKADAYRQMGDLLLARAFYDAALAADPRNAESWQARGEIRAELGDGVGSDADKAQADRLGARSGKSRR